MTPAALYLMAALQRARANGEKMLTVSTLDLAELLAEAQTKLTMKDLEGLGIHPIGFSKPVKLYEMRNRKRNWLTLRREPDHDFSALVFAMAVSIVAPE